MYLELQQVVNFFSNFGGALETSVLKRSLNTVDNVLNPLGPKSDQHQFSPNNISRSSRVKVMRITKFITKGRML